MIILDTHVLWWLDQGSARLGINSREQIEAAHQHGEIAVSAITFWEISLLIKKNRLSLDMPVSTWRFELLKAGLRELPLSGDIAIASTNLELPHEDPADRMIVASAQQQQATLLTADGKILSWARSVSFAIQDATS